MSADFDIQRGLVDMENRIRLDIQSHMSIIRADVDQIRETADDAALNAVGLTGRIVSLEEKAGWIGAGFGLTLAGGVAFIWHMITGKG